VGRRAYRPYRKVKIWLKKDKSLWERSKDLEPGESARKGGTEHQGTHRLRDLEAKPRENRRQWKIKREEHKDTIGNRSTGLMRGSSCEARSIREIGFARLEKTRGRNVRQGRLSQEILRRGRPCTHVERPAKTKRVRKQSKVQVRGWGGKRKWRGGGRDT